MEAAATVSAPPQGLSQPQVDLLYDILKRFDAVAYESGLNYSIACGTALGAVLRGGLIPWDDDADLFARSDEFVAKLPTIVRNASNRLIIKKYTKWSDGRGWYKIYHPRAEYPNVDLYLLEYKPAENVWRPSDPQIAIRKQLYLDTDQISMRHNASFGPLQLPIFSYPERFFDRYYGPKWRIADTKEKVNGVTSLTNGLLDFRPCLPTNLQ